jgi:hypothetical protein
LRAVRPISTTAALRGDLRDADQREGCDCYDDDADQPENAVHGLLL